MSLTPKSQIRSASAIQLPIGSVVRTAQSSPPSLGFPTIPYVRIPLFKVQNYNILTPSHHPPAADPHPLRPHLPRLHPTPRIRRA